MTPTLRVGDDVYFFDVNQRRYAQPPHPRSGPHFRSSFRAVEIVGENRASWILGSVCYIGGRSIDRLPKDRSKWPRVYGSAGHPISGFFLASLAEVDDACWVAANKFAVIQGVQACADVAQLRTIQQLLGLAEIPEIPLSDVR